MRLNRIKKSTYKIAMISLSIVIMFYTLSLQSFFTQVFAEEDSASSDETTETITETQEDSDGDDSSVYSISPTQTSDNLLNTSSDEDEADDGVAVISESDYTAEYDISIGNIAISEAGNYKITGTSSSYTVTISGNVDIIVTLSDVSITSSSAAPIDITNTGTTTLILEGTTTLTQKSTTNACIQLSGDDNVALIIEGDGTLDIYADNSNTNAGAGIGTASIPSGSSVSAVGGSITINSGTITVTHNGTGAAIGTGANATGSSSVTNNMNINITGGTISVTHRSGAGIGGGARMDGGTINISGGIITTKSSSSTASGYCGAGIGGGTYYYDSTTSTHQGGGAGTITITGGTISADSTYADDIGNGVVTSQYSSNWENYDDKGSVSIDGTDVVITAKTILGADDESITSTWNGTVNGIEYTTNTMYTVTFYDSDTTTVLTTKKVIENTAMDVPTDIVKSGYKVVGYYKEDTFTTEWDFDTEITTDISIYVKWEVDTDTIAYVDTYDELIAALADSNKSTIIIQGDITLTSDLTITRDVTIYSDEDYTIDSTSNNSILISSGNVVIGKEGATSTLTITLGAGTKSDPAIMVRSQL